MLHIDFVIEAEDRDNDRMAARLQSAVRSAAEKRIGKIRIIVSDIMDIPPLARQLRKIISDGGPFFEVQLPDTILSADPKFKKVLELAGADRVSGVPAENRNAQEKPRVLEDGMASRAENGDQPQDFLRRHTYYFNGNPVREAVVRLNYNCNERCLFCWLFPDQPEISPEKVKDAIRRFASEGIESISLSGGEPTLSPHLLEYVAFCKSLGFKDIILQTNGVALANRQRVKELETAGLTMVFLALHSHLPDVSDGITRLPGGHTRTVSALRYLLDSEIKICINCVLTVSNTQSLEGFARFCVEEAKSSRGKLIVNFSVPAPIGQIEGNTAEYIPRLDDLRSALPDALDILSQGSVSILGLFTSSCSPPLCVVGDRTYLLNDLREISDGEWMLNFDRDFVKPDKCRYCLFRKYCAGLRRAYAERFGTDEVRPFS